ncbi:MAG: hypothetical protein AAFP90_03350, partial [Planctomycetota bacterium]
MVQGGTVHDGAVHGETVLVRAWHRYVVGEYCGSDQSNINGVPCPSSREQFESAYGRLARELG